MASFRSAVAAGQLIPKPGAAHSRRVRHAPKGIRGVENPDNAGKPIGPNGEIL
jgi:hypothetical protein